MPEYVFSFAGREQEARIETFGDLDAARTGAIRLLGAYLSDHPEFAQTGHWQVNVANMMGQSLLHVIVAAVADRNAPADG